MALWRVSGMLPVQSQATGRRAPRAIHKFMTPELVVDCKYVLHDLASSPLKLVLRDALRGDGAVYGHG